jgi:aryl-alcohol dehydrogenase-like predicted oxidoreductase
VIITKFGLRWKTPLQGERATIFRDASPKYLKHALEASLRRLNVDAISIYMLHWPDDTILLEYTLDMLEQCIEEGKILTYGLSNFGWKLYEKLINIYRISSIEGRFNLIEQLPSKLDYPKARAVGIETLCYGPLAQGLLSGKYDEKTIFNNTDRRHRLPQFSKEAWGCNVRILTILREAAKVHGKTPAQVALRWIAEQGFVSSIIVGTKNINQVDENMGALGWNLDPSWIRALDLAASNQEWELPDTNRF